MICKAYGTLLYTRRSPTAHTTSSFHAAKNRRPPHTRAVHVGTKLLTFRSSISGAVAGHVARRVVVVASFCKCSSGQKKKIKNKFILMTVEL